MGRAYLSATILLVIGAPDQSVAQIVASAYATEHGLLCDSPLPVAWDSLLPDSLGIPALGANSARRRALYEQRAPEYGVTEVPFGAAITLQLQRRSYYLLDSSGVNEVRPDTLIGTARINWARAGAGDSVGAVEAFGQVRLRVPLAAGGGFVLNSDRPFTLVATSSALSADSLLAPGGGTYLGRGSPFREIRRQYAVRETAPETRQWIWIQWSPDTDMVEAGCQYRYTLFALTPEPELVASTDYGCDV